MFCTIKEKTIDYMFATLARFPAVLAASLPAQVCVSSPNLPVVDVIGTHAKVGLSFGITHA